MGRRVTELLDIGHQRDDVALEPGRDRHQHGRRIDDRG